MNENLAVESPAEEAAEYQLRDRLKAEEDIAFGDEYDPMESMTDEERQSYKRAYKIAGKTHWEDSRVPRGHYRTMAGKLRKLPEKKGRVYTSSAEANKWEKWRGQLNVGTDTKGKPTYLVACQEEILIRQDTFREGVVCSDCKGEGHKFLACQDCGGTKQFQGNPCQHCMASSFGNPIPRPTGKRKCPSCQDKNGVPTGMKAMTKEGLIAPTREFEEQPTTGVVISVGEKVKKWKLGDRLMYSKYSGQQIKRGEIIYRIMSQNYPIGMILGDAEIQATDLTEYKKVE